MARSICTMSVLCVLVVAACAQFAVSEDENYNPKWEWRFPSEQETIEKGVPVVEKYIQLMIRDRINRTDADESERYALVSQEYLATQEIDPKQFKLNDYAFEEYKIFGVERNYVRVQGFNRAVGWSRILTFRMVVENGELVIEPSKVTRQDKPLPIRNFLTTWWMTSELIREGRLPRGSSSPILNRGDGSELRSTIPDGMRANSVRVDSILGADFASPGIRVDLIQTKPLSSTSEREESRIVLENVQVLTSGQVKEQNSDGQPKKVTVVTLLVTSEQAQKIILAGTEGIRLAVR